MLQTVAVLFVHRKMHATIMYAITHINNGKTASSSFYLGIFAHPFTY